MTVRLLHAGPVTAVSKVFTTPGWLQPTSYDESPAAHVCDQPLLV